MLKRIVRSPVVPTLAAVAAYALAIRPETQRWGATPEEASRSLPGDDLVDRPRLETTRAITIDAPAAAVWPWLVQIGYQRGGFYSYDYLEEMAGLPGIASAHRIVPELQRLALGDSVKIAPETPLQVAVLEPDRALVLHVTMSPFTARVLDPKIDAHIPALSWSWAFVLDELAARRSRLLIRVRGSYRPRWLAPLFYVLVEPAHFVMERKMLLGIKERAEWPMRLGRN